MSAPRTSTKRLAIFAYGSLLFRPGFAFLDREPATVFGYARRFSQASPDHRGTLANPGRVLTLARRAEAHVMGAVYWVPAPADQLLAALDHRERAGYERVTIDVHTPSGPASAITWIAKPGNPYDVGELELDELSRHVARSEGPSGRNDEYVFLLEAALRELGGSDSMVSALAERLRAPT